MLDVEAKAAKGPPLGIRHHNLHALADTGRLTGLFCDVGVLMSDIDHFKRVNDTFGHAAGDEVIRAVGKSIAGQIRSTDKVARFGGEEFVVWLRETDAAGATLLANRIREAVENTVVTQGLATLSITISIGAAMARKADRDSEDVIARADAALYQAKLAGRNRVEMANAGTELSRAA